MVWQRAGTVSVQTGSNTVVGTNVDFAASSRNGDSFVGPDGATYELANVASSTVISILPAYKGPTVSGAAYAIMPVQGYDKMLSDAFNNLNNQFGPKLAALGTTGNYDTLPVAKGGTGANSKEEAQAALEIPTAAAPLPVAGGGTGAKTVAAAVTALGLDVVTITNANGAAIRFPDGTQICTANVNAPSLAITDVRGSCFAGPYLSAPMFASAFIQPPVTTMNIVGSTGLIWFTGAVAPTTTHFQGAYAMCAYSVTASAYISYMAVGRWK